MSYEFPASVEREVERYAEEANLSPAEASVRLVQSCLEKARLPEAKGEQQMKAAFDKEGNPIP